MGPIGCPETPVKSCHYLLRDGPEERATVTLSLLTAGNVQITHSIELS